MSHITTLNSLTYIFLFLTIFFTNFYKFIYLTITNHKLYRFWTKISNHFHSLLYELEINLKVRWCRMYQVSSKPWKGNVPSLQKDNIVIVYRKGGE